MWPQWEGAGWSGRSGKRHRQERGNENPGNLVHLHHVVEPPHLTPGDNCAPLRLRGGAGGGRRATALPDRIKVQKRDISMASNNNNELLLSSQPEKGENSLQALRQRLAELIGSLLARVWLEKGTDSQRHQTPDPTQGQKNVHR